MKRRPRWTEDDKWLAVFLTVYLCFFLTVLAKSVISSPAEALEPALPPMLVQEVEPVTPFAGLDRLAPAPDPSPDPVRVLALTMWGEARGEGWTGMRAVGHVVRNRTVSPRFPDDVVEVALQPYQFSVWLEDLPDPETTTGPDRRAWREALRLAERILMGVDSDPTQGALFYHADSIRPYWASNTQPATQIGAHVFYVSLSEG